MKRIVVILMTVVMLIGVMTAFAMTSHADAPDATVPKNDLVPFTYNSTGWWWKQGNTDTEAQTAWKTGESVTVENGWAKQTTGVVDNNWATDDKGSVNKYFWAVREFEVPESFDLANSRLWFDLDYDDNIKIYVNGTLALEDGGWSNRKSQEIGAASDYLKVGTNVIAVSLVQGDGGYSFDLGLTATTQLDQTLSVPAGKDYTFYAQTRTNRQNAANKDVRIICVAKQSWLNEIPNFVATFTFTDGTTPKELNSVGLKNVFKSITAYGTNGNVETYTAAEGAVIFGWIITEVPEAYADIVKNTPKATVVTDAEAEPDVKPGVDYETLVTEKTDINVCQDGILYKASNDGKKVGDMAAGDMAAGNGSKATYILTGNYDGVYQLTVSYIDCGDEGGRWLHISVNGTVYSQKMTAPFSGDWNSTTLEGNVKTITLTVEMKKGVNVITFSAIKDNAPNLVDFDLKRIGDVTDPVKTIEASKKYDDVTVSFEGNGRVDGTRFAFMDGVNDKTNITVDGLSAGKYLAKVYYCSQDNGRAIELSVNGAEASFHRVYKTGSWDNLNTAVVCSIPVTLEEGKNTLTFSGHDGVNSVPIWKIELVPVQ